MSELGKLLRELVRDIIHDEVKDITSEMKDGKGIQSTTQTPKSTHTLSVEKGILTEKQVLAFAKESVKILQVGVNVIVTPLAKDALRTKGIRLEKR